MFNKIKISKGDILSDISFKNGNGFYLVSYSKLNMINEVVYKGMYGGWLVLDNESVFSLEFLELFNKDKKEDVILEEGKMNVTEDFLLRLIGISKTSGSNIKVSDIIK